MEIKYAEEGQLDRKKGAKLYQNEGYGSYRRRSRLGSCCCWLIKCTFIVLLVMIGIIAVGIGSMLLSGLPMVENCSLTERRPDPQPSSAALPDQSLSMVFDGYVDFVAYPGAKQHFLPLKLRSISRSEPSPVISKLKLKFDCATMEAYQMQPGVWEILVKLGVWLGSERDCNISRLYLLPMAVYQCMSLREQNRRIMALNVNTLTINS